MITKKCPNCKKDFIIKNNRQIYCSPQCKKQHQKKNLEIKTKRCIICGDTIKRLRNGGRYMMYTCHNKNCINDYDRLSEKSIIPFEFTELKLQNKPDDELIIIMRIILNDFGIDIYDIPEFSTIKELMDWKHTMIKDSLQNEIIKEDIG